MMYASKESNDDSPLNTSAIPASVTLNAIAAQTEAIIMDVDTSTATGRRLMEMGCTPGTLLRVKQSGTSMIVTVFGSTLALDNNSAELIRVIPLH